MEVELERRVGELQNDMSIIGKGWCLPINIVVIQVAKRPS